MADGYDQHALEAQLERGADFETFFSEAPLMNPARRSIKGVVCGVRVEDVEESVDAGDPHADKLIDELAKGKAMAKILREG